MNHHVLHRSGHRRDQRHHHHPAGPHDRHLTAADAHGGSDVASCPDVFGEAHRRGSGLSASTGDRISCNGDWWTSYSGIHAHLLDQGTAARTIFNSLSSVDKAEVIREVANYALIVLIGLSDVQAERGIANNAAREPAPPVLQYELIRLRTGMFIATVLDPHRQRVAQFWSEEDITQIDDDHKEMVCKYQSDTAPRDGSTNTTTSSGSTRRGRTSTAVAASLSRCGRSPVILPPR